MNKIYLGDKYEQPIVVALGFFDCVHRGHAALIQETKRIAEKLGAESAITTFSNDPNALLGKKPQIYSIDERLFLFEQAGIDNALIFEFNEKFAACEPLTALNYLVEHFNVVGLVFGRDFTFGKNAEGDVKMLKDFAAERDIKTKVVPFEKFTTEKISSSTIKKHVMEGNIQLVNSYLSRPYFTIGTIISAKQRGRILGYPTANLSVHDDTTLIGEGIYVTKIYVDGKAYIGVTNVGPKLTFNDNDYTVETHIYDFSKDIYGKTVRLEYFKKIRDVNKFNSVPTLVAQIKSDEQEALDYFNR